MIKQLILKNWRTDVGGNAQRIVELEREGYPAWTVKQQDSYGVAIPYFGDFEINESFAGAKLKSQEIRTDSGEVKKAVMFTTEEEQIKETFSALCEEFVSVEKRLLIGNDPLSWWRDLKVMLGNKNVDDRIYDTLGELCALYYLIKQGKEAEWDGPTGATYDIEAPEGFYEIKSTLKRDRTEVTISSQFQLFPPNKPLKMIVCRFEPAVMTGYSIDSVLLLFANMGYNTAKLNEKLEQKGFEKGMSSRRKKFLLHEMLMYDVNEDFPRVTPESFPGGRLPQGIVKITYTADLSGMEPTSLLQGVDL